MSEVLVFDRAHHRYSAAGMTVPSVSEILAPLYNFQQVPVHVLHRAAALGTAVHRACELDDLEQLDESALHPAWVGHLKAWRWFCADYGVSWDLIEARLHHAHMGYAGTVDRYGLVRGEPTVVDIKTGATLYPAVGPQLAAYAKAIAAGAVVPPQRAGQITPASGGASPTALPCANPQRLAVQLRADGHYDVKLYTDGADWAVFASLLTLRQFCTRHRITPYFKERP